MIRLNLMRNQFGGSASASKPNLDNDLLFDSQEGFPVRRNRKPLWFALAACLVAGAGVGGWFLLKKQGADVPPATREGTSTQAVPPQTPPKAAIPHDSGVTKNVKTESVKPVAVDPAIAAAARAESLRVVEKARKDSIVLSKASAVDQKAAHAKARKDSIEAAAVRRTDSLAQARKQHEEALAQAKKHREDSLAQARKQHEEVLAQAKKQHEETLAQAKKHREDSVAQAKSLKEREKVDAAQAKIAHVQNLSPGIAPAVTAPPLAGGVLDLVLGEARSTAKSASATPTRFEDLAPTGRIAYQRFAFEQILNKLRQVTPANGIGFSRVRVLSPGVLVADGEAQSATILGQLMQGLAAQSLVDTSSTLGANGRFRIAARLPFSASVASEAAFSKDFPADIQRASDLASAQGIELAKPGTSAVTAFPPFRRAGWKLSGTGSWEGCSKWIASLGGVGSPIGFTSVELVSGPDGRLKIVASAIAYGK